MEGGPERVIKRQREGERKETIMEGQQERTKREREWRDNAERDRNEEITKRKSLGNTLFL